MAFRQQARAIVFMLFTRVRENDILSSHEAAMCLIIACLWPAFKRNASDNIANSPEMAGVDASFCNPRPKIHIAGSAYPLNYPLTPRSKSASPFMRSDAPSASSTLLSQLNSELQDIQFSSSNGRSLRVSSPADEESSHTCRTEGGC